MRICNMNAFTKIWIYLLLFSGRPRPRKKKTCIVGDYSVSFGSGNKRLAVPSAYCGFGTAILGPFPISQGHGRDAPKWITNSAVTLLFGNLKIMPRTVPILPANCFFDLRTELTIPRENIKLMMFSDWDDKLRMDSQRKTQSCSLQHSRSWWRCIQAIVFDWSSYCTLWRCSQTTGFVARIIYRRSRALLVIHPRPRVSNAYT